MQGLFSLFSPPSNSATSLFKEVSAIDTKADKDLDKDVRVKAASAINDLKKVNPLIQRHTRFSLDLKMLIIKLTMSLNLSIANGLG